MTAQLHFTNGDSAAELLRLVLPKSKVIPWRDVLHEGPVPSGVSLAAMRKVRARFIAGMGWVNYSDVLASFRKRDLLLLQSPAFMERVLWFEHDLYDQLQLLQILDSLARLPVTPRISLIQTDEYLTSCVVPDLAARYQNRQPVSKQTLKAGAEIWEAIKSGNPYRWQQLSEREPGVLSHVSAALVRMLEELPSVKNGLSRTEQQILEALSSGPMSLQQLYPAAHHQREEAVYMGDTTFLEYVRRLAILPDPLIVISDNRMLEDSDFNFTSGMGLPDLRLFISSLGMKVLAGEVDFSLVATYSRWLGGLLIHAAAPAYRWDSENRTVVTQ